MKFKNTGIDCANCRLNCKYLGELSEEEILRYNQSKREVTFKKGETLFKQNTFVANIIFLKSGFVKLLLEGTSGKDFIARIYAPCEYIGLYLVFGENYSPYTAIALQETTVCMIEINYFRDLVLRNIQLSNNILKLYADDYKFLYDKLYKIGTKNIHGRLAETILYLSESAFTENNIYNLLTRKDIAEISGMSVESMLRLLNEFKNDRIISVEGKKIIINDRQMLLQLSQVG